MKNIPISKKLILYPQDSIISAMKKLNEGSLRFQLVVDMDKRLLGTISDGDIRRAILEGIDLEAPVTKCMNSKPTVSYINNENEHKSVLYSIPAVIKYLPVLDVDKLLKYVLIDEEQIINKTALIMAGGFGKRLGNKTKKTPKPLLKIGNESILELLLKKLEKVNYSTVYISTYYLHEKIESYIKKRDSKINIKLLVEKSPMGTAGCINLIPRDEYESLTVINGDIVSEVDFDALNTFHMEKKNDITLTVSKYNHQVPFGVVTFDKNYTFNSVNEKPVLSHYVLSGIYCLNKSICNLVRNEKIDMTTIITKSQKLDKKIGIFPIHEYWKDIGNLDDYAIASKRNEKKS